MSKAQRDFKASEEEVMNRGLKASDESKEDIRDKKKEAKYKECEECGASYRIREGLKKHELSLKHWQWAKQVGGETKKAVEARRMNYSESRKNIESSDEFSDTQKRSNESKTEAEAESRKRDLANAVTTATVKRYKTDMLPEAVIYSSSSSEPRRPHASKTPTNRVPDLKEAAPGELKKNRKTQRFGSITCNKFKALERLLQQDKKDKDGWRDPAFNEMWSGVAYTSATGGGEEGGRRKSLSSVEKNKVDKKHVFSSASDVDTRAKSREEKSAESVKLKGTTPRGDEVVISGTRSKRRKITNADRLEILWKQALCAICRIPLPRTYHVDHKVPRLVEGGDDVENLQALCNDCHAAKTADENEVYGEVMKARIRMGREKASERRCMDPKIKPAREETKEEIAPLPRKQSGPSNDPNLDEFEPGSEPTGVMAATVVAVKDDAQSSVTSSLVSLLERETQVYDDFVKALHESSAERAKLCAALQKRGQVRCLT